MKVDDQNQVYGGKLEALTVWLSTEDLVNLKNGQTISTDNHERGITVVVLVNDHYAK